MMVIPSDTCRYMRSGTRTEYVTGKRYWYWNSRGRSINALDYLIQIRGYGLVDAVHALVGGEIPQEPAYRSTAEIQVSKEPEKKTFALPGPDVARPLRSPICRNGGSAQKSFASVYKPGFFTKPGIMENRFVCLLGKMIPESEVCLYAQYQRQSQKGCLWQRQRI